MEKLKISSNKIGWVSIYTIYKIRNNFQYFIHLTSFNNTA